MATRIEYSGSSSAPRVAVDSMALSKRQQAARKFRDSIAKSNELHREYLGDAGLLESYDRFTRWQVDYMLSFFDDLVAGWIACPTRSAPSSAWR